MKIDISKKTAIISAIVFLIFCGIIFLYHQYKVDTGQDLSKYVVEFKGYTDISIQLNIYENDIEKLKKDISFRADGVSQIEKENINSKCEEITAFINSNFDTDFHSLELFDDISNIADVIELTRDSATGKASKSFNECLAIIEKSDWENLMKYNHRFKSCINILNECFNNYDENAIYINTEDRSKYQKMKSQLKEIMEKPQK